MVGSLDVVDQIQTTDIRFRKITHYEAYINSIGGRYDAEDSIFIGYFYKMNTPQFVLVNRSQNGNACDFEHEIIEYRGKNCFIRKKEYCFVECVNFLSSEA